MLPLALRLAPLAALAVLPGGIGRALSLATIGPRVPKGACSLGTEGVTVEMREALAVGIEAARGNVATAVTTDTMMAGGAFLEETSRAIPGCACPTS